MSTPDISPKYVVGFGGCLFVGGIIGAAISNNDAAAFVSIAGILVILLYLSIFGIILPLAQ